MSEHQLRSKLGARWPEPRLRLLIAPRSGSLTLRESFHAEIGPSNASPTNRRHGRPSSRSPGTEVPEQLPGRFRESAAEQLRADTDKRRHQAPTFGLCATC